MSVPQSRVTLQQVWESLQETLMLRLLTPLPETEIELSAKDVHRPGMALMGFMENFLTGRLQVLGESEMAFVATLDASGRREAMERLRRLEAPALCVTRDLTVPEDWVQSARDQGMTILRSALPTEQFIHELSVFLSDSFAPRREVHASLVDVYGVGMLISGESGIGKSECALDLVERGHRLVADDIVEISRASDDVLIGRFREVLQHNIEIRGLGVIDVQAVFGIRGVRMQKRIELEMRLQKWHKDADYDRMGLEREYVEYLGVRIPRMVVPIVPGKNITVIAEVIALDFMLKIYGIDSAQDLNRRIMETLRSGDRLGRYLRHDME